MHLASRAAALSVLFALTWPSRADAWGIGSQLDHEGCHERITAEALRMVRQRFDTAPRIAPTRDEAALYEDVQWVPPDDFLGDTAAMTLLLGVRDNDLKGNNPLDSLQLIEVHGDPATQDEHCIRAEADDDEPGNVDALANCRAFIVRRATDALDGLDASGMVDASNRRELAIYASIAGHVDPELPSFYVHMGMAMHALEDGFTHTYRTPDGSRVTVVTNWIESITGTPESEERDGPPHLASLDQCSSTDPLVERNYALAIEAATELLSAALDPSLSREAKIAAFEQTTNTYLTYEPGCTLENNYCDAREPDVVNVAGCAVSNSGGPLPFLPVVIGLGGVLALQRRRAAAAALVIAGLAGTASAQEPAPADEAPAVPVQPTQPEDMTNVAKGEEPGRDEKTPTVAEVQEVREDKRLGSPLGFAFSVGGSVVHGAMVGRIGGRYRISEKWVVGIDGEWNPWITPQPLAFQSGSANLFATLIRRFPMKFDRVNLRISGHLGASMLLFDVYGAPKHSIGLFGAFTPLGIDYDLGNSVRLVIDPVEIAVPMPHIGDIPLYYEQFRFMIGLQIGA